jgi:murein DD-endopeptidase MepM/ murein hydrolase activator NlpD
VKISESQLRRLIREELLKERIGTKAGKTVDWAQSTGKSFFDDAKQDGVSTANFVADIPDGTTIAHPIGRLPGDGPPRKTSGAGPRKSPKSGASSFHKGRDYGIKVGTPIVAFADGTVKAAREAGKAGILVAVNHAFSWSDGDKSGPVQTQYMHLSKPLVSPGDKVKAGQVIALSGNTGNSTGPHLHFTFKIGGKQSANDDLYASKLDSATAIQVKEAGDTPVADEPQPETGLENV